MLFKTSEQDSPEQIMANIIAPELPDKINVLPQPFREVVSHCLIKNANDRAQKAEELIVLLHSHLSETVSSKEEVKIHAPEPEKIVVPIPVVPESNNKKTSFSLENPVFEKPPKEKKQKNEVQRPLVRPNNTNLLRFTIGLAVCFLIALAIIFYMKNSSVKVEKPQEAIPKPKPTLSDSAVVKKTDSIHSKTDSSVVSPAFPEKPPAKPDVTKKKTNVPENENHHSSTKSDGQRINSYILELTSSESCTLTINGEDYGQLKGGNHPMKIPLKAGNYAIHAVSIENPSHIMNRNLTVTEENLHEVGSSRITF
jgi:serine/threonine protein kinase